MATIFGKAKGVTGRVKNRDESMFYEAEADDTVRDLVKVSMPGVSRRLQPKSNERPVSGAATATRSSVKAR